MRAGLEEVAQEYQAQELTILTITYEHAARRRSYELIAEAMGLESGAASRHDLSTRGACPLVLTAVVSTTIVGMTSPRSRILRPLRNAGLDAAYLIVGLPLGIVTFTVAVTGLSLAAGLAITLLGIPILLATLVVCRWFAEVERRRAAVLLGEPIPAPERPLNGNLWERTKTVVKDAASWLDLLWALLLGVVGTIGFSVAISVWAGVLSLISSPLWMWAVDGDDADASVPALLNDPAAGYAALRVAIGLALLPLAYWICRGLALGIAHTVRALLGHAPRSEAPTARSGMPLPA